MLAVIAHLALAAVVVGVPEEDIPTPRQYGSTTSLLSNSPLIWKTEGFLSEKDSIEIIRIGKQRLESSGPYMFVSDAPSTTRTSSTAELDPHKFWPVKKLVRRARAHLMALVHGLVADSAHDEFVGRDALAEVAHEPYLHEWVALTRYGPGEFFSAHHDSSYAIDNPRVGTVIVYLTNTSNGGETMFPDLVKSDDLVANTSKFNLHSRPWDLRGSCEEPSPACTLSNLSDKNASIFPMERGIEHCCCTENLKITPRVGRAIVFLPLWRSGKRLSVPHGGLIHAGCPPGVGEEKYVAQIWFRYSGRLGHEITSEERVEHVDL